MRLFRIAIVVTALSFLVLSMAELSRTTLRGTVTAGNVELTISIVSCTILLTIGLVLVYQSRHSPLVRRRSRWALGAAIIAVSSVGMTKLVVVGMLLQAIDLLGNNGYLALFVRLAQIDAIAGVASLATATTLWIARPTVVRIANGHFVPSHANLLRRCILISVSVFACHGIIIEFSAISLSMNAESMAKSLVTQSPLRDHLDAARRPLRGIGYLALSLGTFVMVFSNRSWPIPCGCPTCGYAVGGFATCSECGSQSILS